MKPEKNAFVLFDMMFWMGMHGLSKVDWTTEWFCLPLEDVMRCHGCMSVPLGGTGTEPCLQRSP